MLLCSAAGYITDKAKIDLGAVRLCFQAFLPDNNGKFTRVVKPAVSQPIIDKSTTLSYYNDLIMHAFSSNFTNNLYAVALISIEVQATKYELLQIVFMTDNSFQFIELWWYCTLYSYMTQDNRPACIIIVI